MRKVLLSTAATLAVFALLGSPSFAQASRPANGRKKGKKAKRGNKPMTQAELLRRYDADGDGVLSDAEKAVAKADRQAAADQRIDAFFDKADKNSDGKLDRQELKKVGPRARMIAKADADKDGFITKAELKAHIAAQRAKAKNGKGKGKGKGRPGKGRPGGRRPGPGGRRGPGGRGPGGGSGSGTPPTPPAPPAPPPQTP